MPETPMPETPMLDKVIKNVQVVRPHCPNPSLDVAQTRVTLSMQSGSVNDCPHPYSIYDRNP